MGVSSAHRSRRAAAEPPCHHPFAKNQSCDSSSYRSCTVRAGVSAVTISNISAFAGASPCRTVVVLARPFYHRSELSAAATPRIVEAIRNGPKGPHVGAFFDFDGTIIDGYTARALYARRLTTSAPSWSGRAVSSPDGPPAARCGATGSARPWPTSPKRRGGARHQLRLPSSAPPGHGRRSAASPPSRWACACRSRPWPASRRTRTGSPAAGVCAVPVGRGSGRNRHRGGQAWNLRSVAVILANPVHGHGGLASTSVRRRVGGRRVIPAEGALPGVGASGVGERGGLRGCPAAARTSWSNVASVTSPHHVSRIALASRRGHAVGPSMLASCRSTWSWNARRTSRSRSACGSSRRGAGRGRRRRRSRRGRRPVGGRGARGRRRTARCPSGRQPWCPGR